MSDRIVCPHCHQPTDRHDQPRLTVDAVVRTEESDLLLVERKFAPPGWALPGGFVDPGESLESAVLRELEEETGLVGEVAEQFHTYSEPGRDPRHHTVSTVFLVNASGTPRAGDDAADARFFSARVLPSPIAFDHLQILKDVLRYLETGNRP